MDQPEQFPEMVGLLDTEDGWALGLVGNELADAGIIYDVVSIAEVRPIPESEKPSYWIPPCRILVSAEDADDARSIVEPYLQPLPNDELESNPPS
jgi:hypothetical protein